MKDENEKVTKVTNLASVIESIFGGFTAIVLLIAWLAGIVLATGWYELLAIFPFYALYLVVEKVMIVYNLV